MPPEWIAMRATFDQVVPLPDPVWQAVLEVARYDRFKKKQILLQPGQVWDRMIFIHQGAMRLYRILDDGLDVTYFFFLPQTFAFATDFASFTTQAPSHYYLECLEDCQVTFFHRPDMEAVYDRYPQMQKFGRLMAEQAYRMMDRRMSHFQFHDLQTRYLALLEEEPALLQRVPQHLIATYLGVTPESLSRIKQQVRRQKNRAFVSYSTSRWRLRPAPTFVAVIYQLNANKRMKTAQIRVLVRWIHLLGAAAIGTYVYTPWRDVLWFTGLMQIVVIPSLSPTGLWLWKGHLLREKKGTRS